MRHGRRSLGETDMPHSGQTPLVFAVRLQPHAEQRPGRLPPRRRRNVIAAMAGRTLEIAKRDQRGPQIVRLLVLPANEAS